MRIYKRIAAGVFVLLAVGFIMGADEVKVTVTVSEMHMCCGGCTKAGREGRRQSPWRRGQG